MRLFSKLQKWWETRQEEGKAKKAAEAKIKQDKAAAEKREADRQGRNRDLARMSPADRAVFLAEANWKMLRHRHRIADASGVYKSKRASRAGQSAMDKAADAVDRAKLRRACRDARQGRDMDRRMADFRKSRQGGMSRFLAAAREAV